jgi:hypothetical protein
MLTKRPSSSPGPFSQLVRNESVALAKFVEFFCPVQALAGSVERILRRRWETVCLIMRQSQNMRWANSRVKGLWQIAQAKVFGARCNALRSVRNHLKAS